MERLVRAEPPRGGRLRAGLSSGSAEPLRACGRLGCRWLSRVGAAFPPAGPAAAAGHRSRGGSSAVSGTASPARSAARPTSCRFQGGQRAVRGAGLLRPGRGSTAGRAEPREGEERPPLTFPSSGAGLGWEGNRGPFGIPPVPYRVGTGGRSRGGRLLPAPRSLSGGASRGRAGGQACPRDGAVRRWALLATAAEKKPFRNALRSDDLPRTIVPRVYRRVSVHLSVYMSTSSPQAAGTARAGSESQAGPVGPPRGGGEDASVPARRRRGWVGEPRCSAASPFPGLAWGRASSQRLWATCRRAAGFWAKAQKLLW